MNLLSKKIDNIKLVNRITFLNDRRVMSRGHSPSPNIFIADFQNNSIKLVYDVNSKIYRMVYG